MKTVYPYMKFIEIVTIGKTKVWKINSASGSALLGHIKWHSAWRQYCLFPEGNTVFNIGCLADIDAFIREAMTEYRKERDARKGDEP